MNVGVFSSDLKPESGGGYTFIQDVANAFISIAEESTHHFTFFYPLGYAVPGATERPRNVSFACIEPRSAIELIVAGLKHYAPLCGYLLRRPCRLERLARDLGVDVMWFVGGYYDTLDMPYITTVWDVQHLTHPWFPEVSARWEWERRELFLARHLRRASRVIVGTELGRDELNNFYRLPRERMAVLPHPTPAFALDDKYDAGGSLGERMAPERVFGIRDNYLFYPAQFWPHKNHANLLLALKRMGDSGHDCPDLVLVGSDKGNKDFIKQMAASLGLEQRVHFLGFVSQEHLVSLYRNAAAMVYPSFSGPENLPPLEAFALGCPVVAADYPGAREQLGAAAVLFDPHDPSDIATKLAETLANAGLCDALRSAGLKRARNWTGKDYVRGVFQLLDGIEPIRRCWPQRYGD